jgi:hypothetical protein
MKKVRYSPKRKEGSDHGDLTEIFDAIRITHFQLGVVMYALNPRTWEAKTEGSGVGGQPQLQDETHLVSKKTYIQLRDLG